jgi:gas vesicle structural protein
MVKSMTVMTTGGGGDSAAGALYDVIELILDRGLVIDVFVRVSLVGIEVLTIDARVVVASIDTYLRFAEKCGRLDLTGGRQPMGLPDLVGTVTEGIADRKVKGALKP